MVASWQRDGGQNTAMTVRGGRKEVSGGHGRLEGGEELAQGRHAR